VLVEMQEKVDELGYIFHEAIPMEMANIKGFQE
jgi:hypothetical protein